MAGTVISRIRSAFPSRVRTRVYDVSNFEPLIEYLEEYLTPVGSIVSKLTTNTPGPAWVLINGQDLSKADYPELYDELGATFGEAETTFKLPDLSNSYLTGVGDTLSGQSVGANALQLLVDNIPSHTHDITDAGHSHGFTGVEHTHILNDPGHGHTVTDPGHAHTSGDSAAASGTVGPDSGITSGNTGTATTGISVDTSTTGVTIDPAAPGGTVGSSTTGISLAETGSSQPFNNRPKSVAVYYFIKARA